MKNIKIISKFIILSLVLSVFQACEDNSETFIISNPSASVLQELSYTDLELDKVNTENPAMTFVWSKADYGVQTPITYDVEFSADQEFTSPVIAATVNSRTSVTLSVSAVNTAVGNAGLNPFEWKPLYVRIVSSAGSRRGETASSNVISVNVLPYFNYTFNDFYLVGDATSPGWDNNNNNPALFRDSTNPDLYYYTGRFSDGGFFKVLSDLGNWQPQYGTDDGSTVGANLGGGSDPERFPTAGGTPVAEGFYTFRINFSTNTFTFEPFTVTTTSPSSLELQGTSTSTIAMTPLAFDGHIWYANNVRLTPGELEFVTNSGARWGSTSAFSGVSSDGGGAIPVVVEDDYNIWFNDLTGRYILIPLNL